MSNEILQRKELTWFLKIITSLTTIGTQPNRYLTRASATIMNRFLKNIGWCESPPFIMSGIKFNVHPIKIWCDGRRTAESIDEQMVLRLQQTFFVGAELPENGKI